MIWALPLVSHCVVVGDVLTHRGKAFAGEADSNTPMLIARIDTTSRGNFVAMTCSDRRSQVYSHWDQMRMAVAIREARHDRHYVTGGVVVGFPLIVHGVEPKRARSAWTPAPRNAADVRPNASWRWTHGGAPRADADHRLGFQLSYPVMGMRVSDFDADGASSGSVRLIHSR